MPSLPISLKLPETALDGGLILRAAGPEDCEALTALALVAKAVWGYSKEFLEHTHDDMAVTPERLSQELVLLVEEAGKPLGVAALGLDEEDPEAAELTLAFVDPAAQGRGVGAILVERSVALAREAGFRRLGVVSDPNAEGFYRRMGFQPAGEYRSEYIPGRVLPELAMAL